MKKNILAGFLAFAMTLVPTVAFAQVDAANATPADALPTNLSATVEGGAIHLTWNAPAYIPTANNAYAILINSGQDFNESTTQYLLDNDILYNILPFEFIGTSQHNFYNLPSGTHFMKVATGSCTPLEDSKCKFTTVGGFSASISAQVTDGINSDSPLYRSSYPACKNPPAHSFDCIDRFDQFKLTEDRFDFGCLDGFAKKGKECSVGNAETPATPKKSVGQPDLTIKVAKATLVKRRIKGVATKQYKIGITVSNKGLGDADGPIYFLFSNTPTNAPTLVTKGILAAGKSKKIFIYADTAEKGNTVLFTADPGNTVDESNENNNTATRVVGK